MEQASYSCKIGESCQGSTTEHRSTLAKGLLGRPSWEIVTHVVFNILEFEPKGFESLPSCEQPIKQCCCVAGKDEVNIICGSFRGISVNRELGDGNEEDSVRVIGVAVGFDGRIP